ncbi:MAG: sterol desaturase family protein [Saprospiraceae bacterium]
MSMYYLIEKFGLLNGYMMGALFVFLRYTFFAGVTFMIFYVIWKKYFIKFKIQTKFPNARRILHEIQHSAYTALVFALMGVGIYFLKSAGYTQLYNDINEFGWFYLVGSFFFLTFLHDTYFYWTHRLMHHPKIFPLLHKVHHISNNPTPFAALSFHPLEAIVEIGIVPVAVLFIPFHPLILLLFATWSLFFNVMGHLGYELFPQGFVHHPILKWLNTSTHHNMHHSRSNCNYGLYYNFWDTVMGTNAPDYKTTFDDIKLMQKF